MTLAKIIALSGIILFIAGQVFANVIHPNTSGGAEFAGLVFLVAFYGGIALFIIGAMIGVYKKPQGQRNQKKEPTQQN